MPTHFSVGHIERRDVLGGKLSLDEANSPSFRDLVQHPVNFFARGRSEPDLDLAVIGRHANQMNFGSELHNRKAMPERIVSSQRTKAHRPALGQLSGRPDATPMALDNTNGRPGPGDVPASLGQGQ
ncbi:hypothetical protein H8A97_00360 [Bradyrhizobium sp. Arg62]|uniref:hypothetical protein n=1 Tax=Bradyrhizobium brasilense TaxID=1419277 RepID=UPI001E49D203|nr:hypothetical protein [Bradyrhizobium brasilense]MCC8943592.1 hypothetical protein [Bradyrhizobium brasilense]